MALPKTGAPARSRSEAEPQWQRLWDGLVATRLFTEQSGSTNDLLYPGESAVANGAAWQPGPLGPELLFVASETDDETLDGVSRLNWANEPLTSSFTVRMILTPTAFSGEQAAFASSQNQTGTTWQFWMGTDAAPNGIKASHRNNPGGQSDLEVAASAGVQVDAVYTYDGADARLYVDGILGAGPTAVGSPNNDPAGRTLLFGRFMPSGLDFDGSIALFQVWSRALGTLEVAQLSNDPFGMFHRAGITEVAAPVGVGTIIVQNA